MWLARASMGAEEIPVTSLEHWPPILDGNALVSALAMQTIINFSTMPLVFPLFLRATLVKVYVSFALLIIEAVVTCALLLNTIRMDYMARLHLQ